MVAGYYNLTGVDI